MRKLLKLIAVIALLNVWGNMAVADGPAVSAQPDLRPGPESSTAGGSASATGGSAGPATVASSEPITASSSNTSGSSAPSSSSTSASGPGTTATAPMTASASQPDPSAPDGSVPAPTSGPSANADASQTSVSASDSRVRANAVATGTASFAGSLAGVGSAEDPTYASTCSTVEASPGVPTDASLGTSCGTNPSFVSEAFASSSSSGNGAAGTPSGSTCLRADATAGTSPMAGLNDDCTVPSSAGPSSGSNNGGVNGAASGAGSTYSRAGTSAEPANVLGIASLPSTATAPVSLALLGMTLGGAGLALLRQSRRKK